MTAWISQFYDRRVSANGASLLWQVGHTENGKPISEQQFVTLLDFITTSLALDPADRFLDLCCGNGVFTRPLADRVHDVTAIDISSALIEVAHARSSAANIIYRVGDIQKSPPVPPPVGGFNKVLMNAALQHFSFQSFARLLKILKAQTAADCRMLFAFVPDASRRDAFNAMLKPSLALRIRRFLGRDLIGHWYHREQVMAACEGLGLSAEFPPVDPSLDGSRYRFNILIR